MKNNIERVGIVYAIILIIAVGAIIRIIDLQFFDKSIDYEQFYKKTERVDKTMPARGSILAHDGRYLAFSTPRYFMCIDATVASDRIFESELPALADSLAQWGEHDRAYYMGLLSQRRSQGKGYTKLLKQHVGYDDMKRISRYPLLSHGRRYGGLIVEQIDYREYPYGKLAFRTLGYLKNSEEKPRLGIEGAIDSILRGKPGECPMKLIEHNIWVKDYAKEEILPVNGEDVQISIDVDIQDIAQRALLRKIENEEDLQAGTVIVMEVATGEIRAMVNMEKDDKGRFTEQYNYAIGRLGEPGSVFKLATLVTALEDGKVKLDDVQSADVLWKYYKVPKPFEDTYLRNYTTITVRKGLEISSNNVFRRIAAEKYDKCPQDFVDKLRNERRISYNFDFDLPGLGKAAIRGPESKYWSPADLPQIGMGYAVQLTPLHILNFYNAIANNGVMVKPHLFVKRFRDGKEVYQYPVEEIGRVCSEATAATAREALRGVVIGEKGTARRAFKDCKVSVAGKTGTARVTLPGGGYINAAGQKKHQGSFVGFFPYENPKYSIIVAVYSRLASKNFYGGTWGGPVAREIIDNIYASSPDWNDAMVAQGNLPATESPKPVPVQDSVGRIPDLSGRGLREATYILESRGFKVTSEGKGKVVSQTPAAGTIIDIEKDCVLLKLAERHDTEKVNREDILSAD